MKRFIFDLDGVLCSTDRFHYLAWKKMADREGIYFDETINQRLRGVSRMESLEIVLERATRTYTDEEKEAMATDKNRLLPGAAPNDGARGHAGGRPARPLTSCVRRGICSP